MEIGSPKLKAIPSFKRRYDSWGETDADLPTYTSLKDIMMNSPKNSSSIYEPGKAFDSSQISIRNELVKHAASAYVLSATINPMNTDQDCITILWYKIKTSCIGFHSCFQINIRIPLETLCRPIVRFFYHIVHRIRNSLGGEERENLMFGDSIHGFKCNECV
ncbi:hypothetical protein CDL12_07628 [Handroanthus impetiginosus]|uniref:Uncharacterized protein n=1 Tax=Handroanthus impetiginosus TaxID=429701 RepID=A0A2G9HQ90_9LAMI|nr:hypothetical protein CDL12_07628 [Handroanthus impetiginosus]